MHPLSHITPEVICNYQQLTDDLDTVMINDDNERWYIGHIPSGNLGTNRYLVNIFLAYQFARAINIAVCETALVNIPQRLLKYLRQHSDARPRRRHAARQLASVGDESPVLAVALPITSTQFPVYDYLPEKMGPAVLNGLDAVGAVALDAWLGNILPARYYITTENRRTRKYFMQPSFSTFGGKDWKFETVPWAPPYWVVEWGRPHELCDLVEPYLERARRFNYRTIKELGSQIPPAWIRGDESSYAQLLRTVASRRNDIQTLIPKRKLA